MMCGEGGKRGVVFGFVLTGGGVYELHGDGLRQVVLGPDGVL